MTFRGNIPCITVWVSFVACGPALDGLAAGSVAFNRDVRPILSDNCFKCHGPDANQRKADLRLDQEAGAMRVLGRGAGMPKRSASELFRRISTDDLADRMPPPRTGKTLSPRQIEVLGRWIDEGAPYEPHWAFVRLRKPDVPEVSDREWPRNEVDRFVLAKQEASGIKPNAEADKRKLIRRAYFDLIGLPPSPEAVEAFVRDNADDAYDRLIEALLSNPHFGERWARHWLDLARFAESHGYEQDYDRKFAYHYRDFVIRAFNEDLPYDTFVKWQIAGDELDPENGQAWIATGFLAAGTHATQITKSQVEKERYDELDDMARTIGTAMLGLTVGCARCHDHKFDPISMKDYYRFVSTFTKTVRSEIPLDLGPIAFEQARSRYEAEHAPLAAALEEYEKNELPAKFEEWLKTKRTETPAAVWLALDIYSYKSSGGSRLARLLDGSLLASGPNPAVESYTFEAKTDLRGITAFRLDALKYLSMPHNGPGRAPNGNFALSDFRVTARPVEGGNPTPLKFANAKATFEQEGQPASAAIDEDRLSAWAIDPRVNEDHSAIFELESPLDMGEVVLTITLEFMHSAGHAIGRPRISITTAPPPLDFNLDLMPQEVFETLAELRANPEAKPSPRQETILREWHKRVDGKWRELKQQEQSHAAKAPSPRAVTALVSSEGLPAVRTHTQGGDFLEATHFLTRGDPNQKGEIATPGFLTALSEAEETESRWLVDAPASSRTPYYRASLANWITDVDRGAGHLLARVVVNRIWQHHMGRGIVNTPSDFGYQGEAPTHPELLDWLAVRLIEGGWRLKPIHKLIMTSATYRQSADHDPEKDRIDDSNALFWRFERRRLEAEIIRDAMLAASGLLDPTLYGPSTLDPDHNRRSVYFTVKRSKLIPMMVLFDAPDATQGIADRPCTTVAPQALYLINNPNVRRYAEALAKRIRSTPETPVGEAIRQGYLLTVGRPPDKIELGSAVAFVEEQAASYAGGETLTPVETAIADFAQVLLGLNEFIYLD